MHFLNHDLMIRTLVLILGPMSVLEATEVELIRDTVLSWLLPANSSSDLINPCYKDISEVVWGLYHQEDWALRMLDAAGKPEAGILDGNIGWVGNYDECIGIRKGEIEGQHCWLGMNAKLIGICLPNSCKNSDFNVALFIDCEYDHFGLDKTSFSAIGICCVLLVFIIAGTAIDVQRRKTQCVPLQTFLRYFYLYSNGKKLFALEDGKRAAFGEFNGLKVIALALVVYVHSFGSMRLSKDIKTFVDEGGRFFAQILLQKYTISIFFIITGFLTFYGVVRKPPTKGHQCHFIFSFILSRYFKMLVAPALIVFVFRIALQPLFSSGPLWRQTEVMCGRNWWKNALFISNWWSMDDQCFISWWFLSVSVQLHLMSLCIIIPLINQWHVTCVISGSAMLVLSWSWAGWKGILSPLYPGRNDIGQYFYEEHLYNDEIFQMSFYYVGPYLTGMALAWVLFKHKEGITLTKKRLFLGWVLSSAFLFLSMWAVYLRPNRMLRNIHNIFAPTMYGLFIAWIILLCNCTKHKGIISSVLSWRYGLPLSKLGLGAYLLNVSVIEYFYFLEVDKMTFSWYSQWAFFLGHWIVTHFMATIAALTIEMPINAIVDSLLIFTKITPNYSKP